MNNKQKTAPTRVVISFSGGRTSAYMTRRMLLEFEKMDNPPEFIVIFANTGLESEETLEFVRDCDKNFDFKTVWIEAETPIAHGKGVIAKIVNFETASRNGEPFEGMIKKFGIPNQASPHCTRSLKEYPIRAHLRSIGWQKKSYSMAIGIRFDEIDRMSVMAKEKRIIYPLIKWHISKKDVISFWQQQTFNLNISEHLGNCKTCWKKSFRKLMTIAKDSPKDFDFFDRMERQYGMIGAGFVKGKRTDPIKFFRGNRSVQDIFEMAQNPFSRFEEQVQFEIDLQGGCGETCEVFSDELSG